MTLVRIIKDYDWPSLVRQTPGSQGTWAGVQFTVAPVEQCDYTIVLNTVPKTDIVTCPPEHIWAIMQEPPTEFRKSMHCGAPSYHRIYTQDEDLVGTRYIHSQPALPWHIQKTYDELRRCSIPDKPFTFSCITSNTAILEGQRARLRFITKVREQLDLDLFGRGFRPIEDKWDALAPYRYSLVIENFQNPYYWTEKLADCLLAWTFPIYIGCTRIQAQLPNEAVACIDINDPDAICKIRSILSSDTWNRNLDAVAQARELILERHQFFPFFVNEIRKHESSTSCREHKPVSVTLVPFPGKFQALAGALSHRLKHGLKQRLRGRRRQPDCS